MSDRTLVSGTLESEMMYGNT